MISAGIPDVGRLITDNILQLLIFPLLLPSLRIEAVNVCNFCPHLSFAFLLFFQFGGKKRGELKGHDVCWLLLSLLLSISVAIILLALSFYCRNAFCSYLMFGGL